MRFKKYIIKHYLEKNYKFAKKNTFNNIFYEWWKKAKIFNWYSIFDNCYIIDTEIYLKDVVTPFLYTPNGKQMFWHRHIIWLSNFHLSRMIKSENFNFYGKFITEKNFINY